MYDTIRETSESDRILRSNLREAIFRANPDYEFLLLDQLPEDQQQLLSALRDDPGFGGLLRPRTAAGATAKAVCRSTAALFAALRTPGSLPSAMLDEPEAERTIARLVLDGILQVAEDSAWLSGPSACLPFRDSALPETEPALESESGALARLSLQAIRHAAALSLGQPSVLSACLYQFNTLPLTPAWMSRLPDSAAVEEYLQIHPQGRNRALLHRHWSRIFVSPEKDVWIGWSSRTASPPAPGTVHYKLYFSPQPSSLRDAFRVWLRAISAGGAHHFKVGASARGLLRPDKIVAYFSSREAVENTAARVAEELSGCPAQGVPFTAELGCGALLSWGSDPPSEPGVPPWLERQSWRLWVTHRLGSALALAKSSPPHASGGASSPAAWAARFAIERLRIEGVDVERWAPVSTAWQQSAAQQTAERTLA